MIDNTVLYRTPIIDPQTGAISREWVKYFDLLTAVLNAGLTETITLASVTTIKVESGVVTAAS